MAALPRLTCLLFLAGTGADPDLFGHLTFGREIVHALAVHRSDPYSFASDIPWVNHEWLAEAIMWLAYAAGGAPGLVALKLLMAAIAGALLLATWAPYRLRLVPREGLLFVIALAAWPQLVSARPQMFSIAAFAWLLYELERFRRGDDWPLWRLPVIFALWVNLHGGWLVGAGVLVIVTAVALIERSLDVRRRRALVFAFGRERPGDARQPLWTLDARLSGRHRPARAFRYSRVEPNHRAAADHSRHHGGANRPRCRGGVAWLGHNPQIVAPHLLWTWRGGAPCGAPSRVLRARGRLPAGAISGVAGRRTRRRHPRSGGCQHRARGRRTVGG